jgi:hypothetical protein
MDDFIRLLVNDVLSPLLIAVLSAGAAWVVTKLPGPLRDNLQSATHARDMAQLVSTMARRATAEIADHTTPPPTPADIVAYSGRVRGDLMSKMDLNPEGLATMASAAIATAAAVPVVNALADALAVPPATAPPA